MDEVVYDRHGRMVYNPEYHPNHRKPFTVDDLIYLCKYNDVDGPKLMSMALGKTEMTVANKITHLRKVGLYEYYKSLSDEQWERIVEEES